MSKRNSCWNWSVICCHFLSTCSSGFQPVCLLPHRSERCCWSLRWGDSAFPRSQLPLRCTYRYAYTKCHFGVIYRLPAVYIVIINKLDLSIWAPVDWTLAWGGGYYCCHSFILFIRIWLNPETNGSRRLSCRACRWAPVICKTIQHWRQQFPWHICSLKKYRKIICEKEKHKNV